MQRSISTLNTHKTIVQLAFCSMKEMHCLSKTLQNCVSRDDNTLIVRFGVIEFLAKEVLTYLLKVNYLDERHEYTYIAELLDDVFLILNRSNLNIDDIKYTAMYDVLGMVDERLKTIRVIYQPVSKNPKPLTLNNDYDPVKFQEISNFMVSKIFELYDMNNKTPINVFILKKKLATVRAVFEYVVENIVFIGTHKVFREQGPNSPNRWSFMQTTIQRCKTLMEEIRYHCLQFILKDNTKNIHQDLRNDMKKTINLLEHAQVMLCYYYRNYVYEPEPLTQVLQEMR